MSKLAEILKAAQKYQESTRQQPDVIVVHDVASKETLLQLAREGHAHPEQDEKLFGLSFVIDPKVDPDEYWVGAAPVGVPDTIITPFEYDGTIVVAGDMPDGGA